MQFFVYILYSEKFNKTYVGLTNNLNRRLKEHNNASNKSTKAYIPWKIIYTESLPDRVSARKREKYFKNGSGREYIRARLSEWLRSSAE